MGELAGPGGKNIPINDKVDKNNAKMNFEMVKGTLNAPKKHHFTSLHAYLLNIYLFLWPKNSCQSIFLIYMTCGDPNFKRGYILDSAEYIFIESKLKSGFCHLSLLLLDGIFESCVHLILKPPISMYMKNWTQKITQPAIQLQIHFCFLHQEAIG